MRRPRLLLVPFITELEWAIRPRLEEWADVASFDIPGVGDEPAAADFGRGAIVRRGLEELERRGWDRCVIVADGFAARSAVLLAQARPELVTALAIGHARLSNATEGPRAPINGVVLEAFTRLVDNDYRAFVRHGLTQLTHGSFGDELAERMLERVPTDVARAAWYMAAHEPEPYRRALASLGVPLLFGHHDGCLISTEEGVEDALAAFPAARSVGVAEAPAVSAEFAEVLREFCGEIRG